MTNARVNEIDLLRFAAALSVVFFHYTFRGYAADNMSVMPYPLLASISKYGYLGVQLFFIISGFVILMTAGNGTLRSFVISRLVRLYPGFWACCTITFVMIVAIGEPRFTATIHQYLINMTMLSGFVGIPAIDGAYWSLFVEMQFYALVIIILSLGRIHQAQAFLVLWLLASLGLEVFYINPLRFLFIVDYSAYFIAGSAYYLIWSQGLSLARLGLVAVSWDLAIFQSLHTVPHLEKHFNTPFSSLVVAAIISSFFIVMLLISLKRTLFFARYRWSLAGVLTYPLYLIHSSVGFMLINMAYPAMNPHLLLWGTILAVLVMAYAVHLLVEKPFSSPMKNALNRFFDHIHGQTMRFRDRARSGQ